MSSLLNDYPPRLILHRLALAWGIVLYLLIPTAVISWLINPSLIESGIFAAAVGALATLMHQHWKIGAIQITAFAVLGFVACLASPYPIAGGLLMAFCGLALGLSSRWAWNYSLFLIPILLISILINPIPAKAAEVASKTQVSPSIETATSTFWVLLAAGVVSVLLCLPILRYMDKKHSPRKLPGLPSNTATYYGIVLAVCLGVSTWVVLAFERVPDASWLLLTLVLLLQPAAKLTLHKSVVRSVGTLAGSAIAVLIGLITVGWVVALITFVLAAAASVAVFDTSKRYWLWVVLWTPSIILLTSQSSDLIKATEFRAGMTVVAALVALAIALAVQFFHPQPTNDGLQEAPKK